MNRLLKRMKNSIKKSGSLMSILLCLLKTSQEMIFFFYILMVLILQSIFCFCLYFGSNFVFFLFNFFWSRVMLYWNSLYFIFCISLYLLFIASLFMEYPSYFSHNVCHSLYFIHDSSFAIYSQFILCHQIKRMNIIYNEGQKRQKRLHGE